MTPPLWMGAIVLALAVTSAVAAQSVFQFVPPRVAQAAVPAAPGPHVVGGGQVLIEAIVSRSGLLTQPVVLRSTPPYTQLVLDAIPHWRFLPATATDRNGKEAPAEAPVLIAAIYRPPTLLNGPTAGQPPASVRAPSADVPLPVDLITPAYPVKAANVLFAPVLFEVQLDERGQVRNAVAVAAEPGFESVARDAVMQWRFRPASFDGRPVPGSAYVFFGFSAPVIVPARSPNPAPSSRPVSSPR